MKNNDLPIEHLQKLLVVEHQDVRQMTNYVIVSRILKLD